MEKKISTGSYDLNKWLYGGYDTDIITTIYGPAGSGKTNFCILASVSQAKKGKKVIFIDTEGGFSLERIKQITSENYEEVIKNILVVKIVSWEQQKKYVFKLYKEIKEKGNLGLIIIDSMTMLYRLELADAKEKKRIREINSELARQMKLLAEIARLKNIPIIITNQVYSDFSSGGEQDKKSDVRMVGGDLLRYWSKCLIELQFNTKQHKAILRKHRSLKEKELIFVIEDKGIKRRGWF